MVKKELECLGKAKELEMALEGLIRNVEMYQIEGMKEEKQETQQDKQECKREDKTKVR